MQLECSRSVLRGSVEIPGSKSHTIRAVTFAALADGESLIEAPLQSEDARASVVAFSALGATWAETPDGAWRMQGVAGVPRTPDTVIDVANSGTTLRIALGACALLRDGMAVLTGDAQIRRRPAGPLVASLNDLGARVVSTRGKGLAPFVVQGLLRGGSTQIEAVSSQFLTSLLINAPLAETDTTIRVTLLNEAPYVHMTLDWLAKQGVDILHSDDLREFRIPGGQSYQPVCRRIPGDFSSATFFLAAGALPGNDIVCRGLDMNDTQGDKAVTDYLCIMGADVSIEGTDIRVRARDLAGCEIDLNATPDALPMMAALACFARGETRLVNVPQARIKETDRIAVMRAELSRMGADIEELSDGLIIRESKLHGAVVDSHDDHRVAMALAIAATQADGVTTIRNAEAMGVTFPGFVAALAKTGGAVRRSD